MWGRLTFLLVVALELMIFCVGCARFEVSDSGEPLLYDVCMRPCCRMNWLPS